MDDKALSIVIDYISNTIDPNLIFDVYIVLEMQTLQNWKYLISSTLAEGMYYELTYNGDTEEWYLDAYRKIENVVINK